MKITVRDNNGKETNKVFELNTDIFESKANMDVLRQAIHVHLLNTRAGTAKSKGRGEVSGTGKKPWGNNKLERARTGDLRTPIFTGGGVSHGPVPMNYAKKLTKKMQQIALNLALTDSATRQKIHVVEDIVFEKDKLTKTVASVLGSLQKEAAAHMKNTVLYYTDKESKIALAARNLPRVKALLVTHMDPFDLVSASDVVFLEGAMEVVNKSKAVVSKKTTTAKTATVEKEAPVKEAATVKKTRATSAAKTTVRAKATTTKTKAKTK